jgi:hypothetical protein
MTGRATTTNVADTSTGGHLLSVNVRWSWGFHTPTAAA